MVSSTKLCLILILTCSLFIQETSAGEVICEKLPKNLCSFAVSSAGKRCALEVNRKGGKDAYECKTSEIDSERLSGHIENEQCMTTCGLGRRPVVTSNDPFLSPQFTALLCAPACYHNCPNIVDLYSNLAAGEGLSLPALCNKLNGFSTRSMAAIPSIGGGASPAGAPAFF